jgi:hypothetical protein
MCGFCLNSIKHYRQSGSFLLHSRITILRRHERYGAFPEQHYRADDRRCHANTAERGCNRLTFQTDPLPDFGTSLRPTVRNQTWIREEPSDKTPHA